MDLHFFSILTNWKSRLAIMTTWKFEDSTFQVKSQLEQKARGNSLEHCMQKLLTIMGSWSSIVRHHTRIQVNCDVDSCAVANIVFHRMNS